MIPLNINADSIQASQDFIRARNKALFSRIQHFMEKDRDNLLSLTAVREILKPRSEVYRGMQSVPICRIVGSEGRYRDFNRYFFPRSEYMRARWESIDRAQIRNIILPPISLYEVGGVYFVRDGNHRVSVARYQGMQEIDAEVISLSTEVKIDPDMTVSELASVIIAQEKKIFYEKTSFGSLTGDWNLDFTQPGRYDLIYNHIEVHKYFLNQNYEEELPFESALVSWYNEVYCPIIKIIKEELIALNFPGRSLGDLYVWIVQRWDWLKKENDVNFSIADAARSFVTIYAKNRGRFFRFLAAVLRRLISGIRKRRS